MLVEGSYNLLQTKVMAMKRQKTLSKFLGQVSEDDSSSEAAVSILGPDKQNPVP
jgi:hypothetical protein